MYSDLEDNVLVHFESSGMRKMEANGVIDSNGICRFKKQKISAVREFPTGCGRLAQRISRTPQIVRDIEELAVDKDSSTSDHVQHGAALEKDRQSHEFSEDVFVIEHLDPLAVLQPEHVEELASVTIELNPPGTPKCWDHVEPLFFVSIAESAKVSGLMQQKSSCHSSARRRFPYGCGRSAQQLTEEEKSKFLTSFKSMDGDNKKSLQVICKPGKSENKAEGVVMKNVSNDAPVVPASGSRSSQSEAKTFSEFSDKEINVVPQSAKTEKNKVVASKNRLAKESAAPTKQKVHFSEPSMKPVNVNSEGQRHKKDPIDVVFSGGKMVVLALMAPPNCPWRQGKPTGKSE